jgi:histidyl-tRNA synthetase
MADYQTVRGMRDFLPEEMKKREYVAGVARRVFEKYGFELMETPAVESFELLSGKGGGGEEVKKEIYCFKDQGGRELGLRFDLTVPTARVVASNPSLTQPFKRAMVGRVWRYDRPGAGRYREFWQADVDVFGSESVLADAEVVATVFDVMDELKLQDFQVNVNNRKLLEGLAVSCGIDQKQVVEVFRSIDKLEKIGEEGVQEELESKGVFDTSAKKLLDLITIKASNQEILDKIRPVAKENKTAKQGLEEVKELLDWLGEMGFGDRVDLDLSLARGLDYYTGNVFEGKLEGEKLSVSGGGRYDGLVEAYGGKPTPATGWSIGIERVIEVLEDRKLFPELDANRVFVAPVNDEMREKALKITQELRDSGVKAETDLMGRKLSKQFSFADSIGASRVVVVGPKDLKEKKVTLRDMKTGNEEKVLLEELVPELSKTKN